MMEFSFTDKNLYFIMNKPEGVVCSAVSDSHKTVYELLPKELQALVQFPKRGCRLHTVGRLDCETSGLLLFTTDGNFSHFLTSPENHIEKTYRVHLEAPVTDALQSVYINSFSRGMLLPAEKKAPEQKSSPAVLSFLSPEECLVTVTEGKFHEVRRLFLAAGNKVQSLCRIKFGPLVLDDSLKPGEFRKLSMEEIRNFFD